MKFERDNMANSYLWMEGILPFLNMKMVFMEGILVCARVVVVQQVRSCFGCAYAIVPWRTWPLKTWLADEIHAHDFR
jgi:hypothetical protein